MIINEFSSHMVYEFLGKGNILLSVVLNKKDIEKCITIFMIYKTTNLSHCDIPANRQSRRFESVEGMDFHFWWIHAK